MSDLNNDPKLSNAEAKAAKAKAKALRPWFKKKRFILPIALVLLIGIGNATGGNSSSNTKSSSSSVTSTDTTDSTDSTTDNTDTTDSTDTPSETAGQANARQTAEDYLSTQSFSRIGLIKQLEFEKYSHADAVYGVDALNVDWNEQAAQTAQDYLSTQSFSRQGLIDQLKFEGFTTAQAKYGVTKAGL
jgi:hypothetical protein